VTDHPATAVVLGASMSGLLAARALSPIFTRIIVVERDALPDGATLRQGVPQAGSRARAAGEWVPAHGRLFSELDG
jgi:glycine/D-amino acid oxidase-like deaminating enzyme